MFRGRVSYPLHAGLELITAAVLITVPFAVGLPLAATVTAGAIGVLLFGLAVSATGPDGRGTLPISAHAAYDAALALALVGAAVFFGVAGEQGTFMLLLSAGVAQLALSSVTRYGPVRA